MAFTGRHPFVTDAFEHGFLPGVREDYSYQIDDYPNVDLPILFLDNHFYDPDLDRYLDRFHTVEPSVAVVGDAPTSDTATVLQKTIDELRSDYADTQFVAVPKCAAAFEIFADDVVLGYPNGYSTVDPAKYSDLVDWRGHSVHILGGNPHSQRSVLQILTQPTLAGDLPADIVGVDGNGVIKAAYKGEDWTADGYQSADHLSIRETVDRSLLEMKGFWQSHGVWPATTPLEEYGPAVLEPDDPVYATGGDIRTRDDLETAYVEPYDGELTRAYQSETTKRFVEYRDGLD